MDCNDINRRVRYALKLDDADVAEILEISQYSALAQEIAGWRLKEGQEGHRDCPPSALFAMLDGLIIQRRGPRDDDKLENDKTLPSSKAAPRKDALKDALDNNHVLKQLRIALSLRAEDVHLLIQQGGGKLGKSEVNALFRKPSARNYRRCGDQVLRWFLTGLARQRGADDS